MNFCFWHRHWRRAYCSARFSSGGLWCTVLRGVSSERPALWFFGSMLARTSIALAGFYFVGGENWERWVLCLLGFVLARLVVELADAPAGRSQQLPRYRRPAMRLSSDEMIFWQYGFLKLNGTIIFTWGLMFVMACRPTKLITRNPVHGTETFPLAEPAGNRCHWHREANRGCRPPSPQKYIGFLRHALSVRSGLPASAPSFPATSRRRGRYLRRRRSRCACLWLYLSLGVEETGAGRLPQILCGTDKSLCCRLTSSANCRARCPCGCACSET